MRLGRYTPLALAISTVGALAQAAPSTAAQLAILLCSAVSGAEWWRRGG
jgi:hypothetical protein